MPVATFLAGPEGRWGRILTGVALAIAGMLVAVALGHLVSIWTFLVVMLGAEIAVGGALNVCVLCPLFGLPFQGRRL